MTMRDKFEHWYATDIQRIMAGTVEEKAAALRLARDHKGGYVHMFMVTAAWKAYQKSRIHAVQEAESEGTGEVLATLEVNRVPKGGVRATVTREKRQNDVILAEYYCAIGYEEPYAVKQAQEASVLLGWTIEGSEGNEDDQEGEDEV